jgi:molybdopterin-guanine dinucleotide biosynthesis adapter protein
MIPLVSLVGKSGVGKTTLIEKLVGELKGHGYRVGVIKHHAHATSLDAPGKDSWRFGVAGADVVVVASPIEVVRFECVSRERTLAEIAAGIQGLDMILTEGFRREPAPKIEVMRKALGSVVIAPPGELIAVASDCPLDLAVPRYDIDDIKGITAFLLAFSGLTSRESARV